MMTVTITTAVKLTPKQLGSIQTAVEKKYGKKVEYVQEVDPTVLGGIRVLIGSTMIDRTIQSKLTQLRSQLVHLS